MESQIFSIVLDDKNKTKMKLDINSSLSDIKLEIKKKIKINFSFLDNEKFFIDEELENEMKINDLKSDNIIYLKSNDKNEIQEDIKINIKPKKNPLPDAKLIEDKGKYKIYQYPRIEFTPFEESNANIVLVVGQTGSGKSTFINAFINYLMDIDLSDDFRYNLIVENERIKTESQTKGLHIYNIGSKNMILKLVDTQGFGDTGGISEDDKITLSIKDAFMKELNSLNAILFVVKSSDTRLTSHQKYIFSSIISLFGKDIKENFLALITFYSTSGIPSAITTLEQSDFKDIIESIKKPWYLCFDNTIIFGDPNDDFNEMAYKRATKNYKSLCDKIKSLERKSLILSKENLDLREKIKIRCTALEELLKLQMDKLIQIDTQKKYIEENEKKINNQEIKFIPITKTEMKPEKLQNGQKATICKICKFNCHFPCWDTTIAGIDLLKYSCKIWTWGFNCCACPNQCPQSYHELSDSIYKAKQYTEYKKIEFIAKKGEVNGLNIAKNALKNLKDEEIELKKKIKIVQEEIKEKYSELKKVAINYSSYQTTIEFLQELINEEKRTMTEGYMKRIEQYDIMIKENKILLNNI